MPSPHFNDFSPELVEPEPPTPEVLERVGALSSDDEPAEDSATQ